MTKEKFPTAEQGENNSTHEKAANLWNKMAEREAESKAPTKKWAANLMATAAVGLILLTPGAMGNKAEAQGFRGRVTSKIFRTGTFEASSAIDRSMNQKIDKLENDYVKKLGELGRMKAEAYQEYGPKIRNAKVDSERESLENEYQTELGRIAQAKIDLRQAYEKEKRNLRMKKEVASSIFRGLRGY